MSEPRRKNEGLPVWVTITVVLTLLGTFVYNIVIVGPEGYPTNVIIGGLLGAYAGVDQFIKRRRDDDPQPPQPPPSGENP